MNPLILIILDGWGLRSETKDNGIALANTPNFDHYWNNYPHTTIQTSGPSVGLPKGIMGNSEVGHMNLGAGRVVHTGLSQIYQAIEDKSFYSNPALLKAVDAVKKNNASLHLMGLLSDGAVHSHEDHLYALLEFAKQKGLKRVFVHCLMDGRDTPPQNGIVYIRRLEKQMKKKGIGKMASVCGRYYAMDRDKRWDRIEKAFDVFTGSNTEGKASAEEIVLASYKDNVGDEFIVPKSVLDDQGNPCGTVQEGDAIIFFNFRADRAREITRVFTDPTFKEFKRTRFPKISCYVCMAPYDETFPLPVAFTPQYPKNIFPQILSQKGLSQLRIAETEKYAHVTFFFNGGQEIVFKGEERVLIPSPREVATYDLKPEMSALAVKDEVCRRMDTNQYQVIILNFANADMVGHTAKPKAIIKAVETVDQCLKPILSKILQKNGIALITADHGNAEQMVDENGNPHTAHTTNLVPLILVSNSMKQRSLKKKGGRLCDVAPTLLELLAMDKPKEMTGESLIEKE